MSWKYVEEYQKKLIRCCHFVLKSTVFVTHVSQQVQKSGIQELLRQSLRFLDAFSFVSSINN